MAVPTINAVLNFSTGPATAQAMQIDIGQIGINVFADAVAVIVDVSDQVNYIKTNRGRNAQSDQFQTGTLSMRIIDQNGNFNPTNVSSPYYLLLTPMKKVQVSANYNGITYNIFSGFITSYIYTNPLGDNEVAYTTITAVDAYRLASLAQITTVAGATAGDLSGTRVTQILDQISWPQTMRDIDAGLTTLQNDPGTTRTSLAALQTVSDSEYGAIYVSPSGFFVFQDRSVTVSSINGTPVVFADDGSGIKYSKAAWVLNDQLVFNSVSVTRTGGTAQTATNSASITKYFLHSYYLTNLLMQTDAAALNYALAYCASRAETTVRVDEIELDLYTPNYDTGIVAALSLDYFDPITVKSTQPGGSTLQKTLQVFGVSMLIQPQTFKVVFQTLEPIIDGFVIGYGKFDLDVLSY